MHACIQEYTVEMLTAGDGAHNEDSLYENVAALPQREVLDKNTRLQPITQQSSESDLTANEVQLWILLQMQKVVQKMQDVSGADEKDSADLLGKADTIPYLSGISRQEVHVQAQSIDTNIVKGNMEQPALPFPPIQDPCTPKQSGNSTVRACSNPCFHTSPTQSKSGKNLMCNSILLLRRTK